MLRTTLIRLILLPGFLGCCLPAFGGAPATQPAKLARAIRFDRRPGEGSSSGPLASKRAQHTPWDHPYIDTAAAASMDNIRYSDLNLDALASSCGFGGCGFGLGFACGGGFGYGYNTGSGGLPR